LVIVALSPLSSEGVAAPVPRKVTENPIANFILALTLRLKIHPNSPKESLGEIEC
ncbi:MAG: hypothetical protein XD81_0988, partial [Bacteroidetes bacterium 38_7]